MILELARSAPQEVRATFRAPFDECADLVERIARFKEAASALLDEYGDGGRRDYRNENSIGTYLWVRYPDRHYIYKYGGDPIITTINDGHRAGPPLPVVR